MKKITTLLAASALTLVAAQASAATFYYSVVISGETINTPLTGPDVSAGSSTGTGFAQIELDLADLGGTPGTFTMQTSTTTVVDFPLAMGGSIESDITGSFNAQNFIWYGSLSIDNGSTNITSCVTNSGPPGGGFNFCNQATAVNPNPFVISNFTSYDLDGLHVSFDVVAPTTTNATYGDFNTVVTYDLYAMAPPAEVPVPAAAWLFGSALVGLAGIGRKRKIA